MKWREGDGMGREGMEGKGREVMRRDREGEKRREGKESRVKWRGFREERVYASLHSN